MKHYTEIPPTSDLEYWQVKSNNLSTRSKTFVPRNPELHHQLKTEAWEKIQAKLRTRSRQVPEKQFTPNK